MIQADHYAELETALENKGLVVMVEHNGLYSEMTAFGDIAKLSGLTHTDWLVNKCGNINSTIWYFRRCQPCTTVLLTCLK